MASVWLLETQHSEHRRTNKSNYAIAARKTCHRTRLVGLALIPLLFPTKSAVGAFVQTLPAQPAGMVSTWKVLITNLTLLIQAAIVTNQVGGVLYSLCPSSTGHV